MTTNQSPATLFTVTSLGCKVNQAESAWIKDQLGEEYSPSASTALLFTCAVTARASRQSQQMARRLSREYSLVIVTGCDVQAHPEKYPQAAILPRYRLAGAKELIQLCRPLPLETYPLPAPEQGRFSPGLRKPSAEYTRGQLKVQDGCDAFCSYCIVPHTRGKPRSLPLVQACASFIQLAQAGAREVVLSGIHLGRYAIPGVDDALTFLLQHLLSMHRLPRIRLSSLEANELTPSLLELMAADPRICPHLHLPLQSGSDKILRAMGRTYQSDFYAQQVATAAKMLPGACLGADVMVGFPGETEEDFITTFEFLRTLPVNYMHVFPYSPRPGTKAAAMPEQVDSQIARERAQRLRELSQAKWQKFMETQVGASLQVLAESRSRGRAENYCLVKLPKGVEAGQMLTINISKVGYGKKQVVLQ